MKINTLRMFNLKRYRKLLTITLLIITISLIVCPVKAEDRYVIPNTKDWRDIYIAGIYSSFTDREIIYISNLNDAQMASDKMSESSDKLILESENNYVVKNYKSFLEKNGHINLETKKFEDYSELQSSIFEDVDFKGLFILNPKYGSSAVVSTPYIIKNDYIPFFINSENVDTAKSLSRLKDNIVAGRIPIKYIEDINGEKISGSPFDVVNEVTRLVIQNNEEEWALVVKADEIDPVTLKTDLPVFIFMGNKHFSDLIELIEESKLTKFEVIGASMNDVAQRLDSSTSQDLKIMLKYGMFVARGAGKFREDVQTLDTIFFDYPIESLEAKEAVYYPKINRLGVTFRNTGNLDIMFFSTVDFLGSTIAEEDAHHILPGQTKTIPFKFSGEFKGKNTALNTRYGCSFPLDNFIPGEEGELYYDIDTKENDHYEESNVSLIGYGYDYENDKLILDIKNPNSNSIVVFAELELDEEKVRTSKVSTISAKGKGRLEVETPYTSTDEIAHRYFNVTLYFGEEDTLNTKTFEIEMKEYPLEELNMIYFAAIITVLIIIILILIIKRRKKGSKSKSHKK